jgi:hypothetical protein
MRRPVIVISVTTPREREVFMIIWDVIRGETTSKEDMLTADTELVRNFTHVSKINLQEGASVSAAKFIPGNVQPYRFATTTNTKAALISGRHDMIPEIESHHIPKLAKQKSAQYSDIMQQFNLTCQGVESKRKPNYTSKKSSSLIQLQTTHRQDSSKHRAADYIRLYSNLPLEIVEHWILTAIDTMNVEAGGNTC